jgi:ketosteroid isomerase-like protein
MAHGNVELVRRALAAYARRDLDTLRDLNHPDVELDWSASRGWFARVYRGWDEAVVFYNDYFDFFEEITIEAESYREAGDSVAVPNTAYQRGRDGIEVTARSTIVFTLRDGRFIKIRLFQEEADALLAVGLA